MLKLLKLLILLLLTANASDVAAKSMKLGDMIDNRNAMNSRRITGPSVRPAQRETACMTNEDCPFQQECVALRCLDVCTPDTCIKGKYCVATKDKPHQYQCVECAANAHCPKGFECSPKSLSCVKIDVCRDAVCSPAAPYCIQVPYKTLPYTCVQCLTDEHCPPVAGLTRSCIDNYCLFNVENNIPRKTKKTESDLVQTEDEPLYETEEIGDDYESADIGYFD